MLRHCHYETLTLINDHFLVSPHLAIESIDELLHIRESDARRHKDIEDLKQQLADAQRRIDHLCRELNGRSLTMGN